MDTSVEHSQGELQGQVAIITGAANGIGRGMALAFAQQGATIVIADIDRSESLNSARLVENAGGQALVVPTDVRQERDLDNLVDETLKAFDRVDILVNNAGINAQGGLLGVSRKDAHSVFDTDLLGPFFLTQRVAQEMVCRGIHGRIVCISSIHSVVAHYHPHYSIAKIGLERLVIDAALELAPYGIRVNGIRPGGITTLGNTANVVPAIPLEARNGLTSEVGELALFLVTDHSRYITGTIVTIDGALSHQSYSAIGSYDHILATHEQLGIPLPPSRPGVAVHEVHRGRDNA
jgi:NAD(P)-dependent dehydrogenase (short-subunit alcohol dehydrogenase family)